MNLEEALTLPDASFWKIYKTPVIETSLGCYYSYLNRAPRRIDPELVDEGGAQISREEFLELLD